MCAVACDADWLTAICQGAADLPLHLAARLGLPRCRYTGAVELPAEKTIGSVLSRLDLYELWPTLRIRHHILNILNMLKRNALGPWPAGRYLRRRRGFSRAGGAAA